MVQDHREAVARAYWKWVRGFANGVSPAHEAALISKLESRAAEMSIVLTAEQLLLDLS